MHDFSRPPNEYAELVNLGNTFESTWMLLDEAERRKDAAMFQLCADRLKKHVETGLDAVYGGVFHTLFNVDEDRLALNKILWAQTEVLVDALYIYERTGAEWARDLFNRMYSYVREKYPLTSHGSPLWMYESGRKADFEGFRVLPKRVENYHHPRHLMLNLGRLDRMIAEGVKIRRLPPENSR
jgi:mannose/cellobiose epimerase-like protein (N-acyl-D-glucosamine 2-epimerase family)